MLTLGNQRDLTVDMLIKGIIDSVVTVNQFYAMLPFKGIQGNALAYNREKLGADQVDLVSVIDTRDSTSNMISKAQQEFSRHSTELTTIIGDAQVNGLIQAVGSDYNDATAVQVAAKAKGMGRTYMNLLVNGTKDGTFTTVSTATTQTASTFAGATAVATGVVATVSATGAAVTVTAANVFASGLTLTFRGLSFVSPFVSLATGGTFTESGASLANAVARYAALTGSNATNITARGYEGFDGLETFVLEAQNNLEVGGGTGTNAGARLDYLDQLIDRVHDKDGMVDYIMANSSGVRKITQAFRTAGTGFDMMDVKTSSGAVMSVQSYRGVPILRNDFIGATGISGSNAGLNGGDVDSTASAIFVGTLDDGSLSHGICGLTATKSAGMQVQKLGAMEASDADITRVKWYCGLAHFSELGLVKGYMV